MEIADVHKRRFKVAKVQSDKGLGNNFTEIHKIKKASQRFKFLCEAFFI